MRKQKLPEGYTEKRIRAIADHYENQPEAEAVAEDEVAWGNTAFTFVQVPVELVDDVQRLIAQKKPASKQGPAKVAEGKKKYT